MSESVTITMTREHAEVVQDACEMLMRLKHGNISNVADLVLGVPGVGFEDYRLIRDIASDILQAFLKNMRQYAGETVADDEIEQMAYEIYGTIRHALYIADGGDPDSWSVAAREPLSESGHDMPKCEVTNDG